MTDTNPKDAGPTAKQEQDGLETAGLYDQQRGVDQSDLPSINASMIEIKGEADSRNEESQSVNSIQFEVPQTDDKKTVNDTRAKSMPRMEDQK